MRAHRFFLLLGLVPVCHCGARTSFDTGSPPSPPAATGMTAQDFAGAFPEAFCARYGGCCGRAGGTDARCLDEQRRQVERWAQGEGQAFDPARGAACLGALRAWSESYDLCQLDPREEFATCWGVYNASTSPSLRFPGESCGPGDTCAGKRARCAVDENTDQRNCREDPWNDGKEPLRPCRTDEPGVHGVVYDCGTYGGRTCSLARNECLLQRGVGEPCDVDPDCLDPLFCSGGACAPALAEGQACGEPLATPCAQGLDCGSAGACVRPVEPVTAGQPCAPPFSPAACGRGSCVDGVCRDVGMHTAFQCGLEAT